MNHIQQHPLSHSYFIFARVVVIFSNILVQPKTGVQRLNSLQRNENKGCQY